MSSNVKNLVADKVVNPDPYVRIFDVKEIRVLHTEQEVNHCLKNGWVLFRVFTENSFVLVRT